jgi:hypothetical protein
MQARQQMQGLQLQEQHRLSLNLVTLDLLC